MSDASAQEGFDNIYSICGFLGGVVFAVSLIPQLYKTFSTKSANDLSYFWQATYLLGLAGLGVYCIAYTLWPMLGPGIADFALMALLTAMKYYYDNKYPKVKEELAEKAALEGSKEEEECKPSLEDEKVSAETESGQECTMVVDETPRQQEEEIGKQANGHIQDATVDDTVNDANHNQEIIKIAHVQQ